MPMEPLIGAIPVLTTLGWLAGLLWLWIIYRRHRRLMAVLDNQSRRLRHLREWPFGLSPDSGPGAIPRTPSPSRRAQGELIRAQGRHSRVPPHELDTLVRTAIRASDQAREGALAAGYTQLRQGLQRAEEAGKPVRHGPRR